MGAPGLHDPRVAYWEPAKFVAKLRDHKTDDNMQLFKCDFGAGAPALSRPCALVLTVTSVRHDCTHCTKSTFMLSK